MGFWSGIKHALNSTLGTANFQPLDEIIKSQRTYGASDTVLAVLGSEIGLGLTTSLVKVPNIKFVSTATGSIRIKTALDFMMNKSGNGEADVYIYKNGTLFKTISYNIPSIGAAQQLFAQIMSLDIPIEKGSEYTFYVKIPQRATVTLQSIQLCGQIVDLSMLEYTTY
jgi:hypothetical protein